MLGTLLLLLVGIDRALQRAVSRAHGAEGPAAQLADRVLLDDGVDVDAGVRRHHVQVGSRPDVLGARARRPAPCYLLILLPFTFIQFFYAPWLEARDAARAPRELPDETEGHVLLTGSGPDRCGAGRSG